MNEKKPLSRREIFRFFKETGEVGVAIGLLSLADTAATFCQNLTEEKWGMAVKVTKGLFSAWWEHRQSIVWPSLLLDGEDLQKEFGLKPGKQIGQLLRALEEAQAVGEVNSVEEAKTFIRSRIDQTEEG
ncbi:MAG: hypothetical protein ACOCYU_06595 [Brevefilum sp.]